MLAEILSIDLPKGGEGFVPTAQELFTKYPTVGVLLGFMLLDIVTGLIAAFVMKKLCSTASFRGMMGKAQILAMVAASMLAELIIPNVPWGTFMAMFFCVTEMISITENAANSGVPIPKQWVDALKKARQEEEIKKAAPLVNLVVNESGKEAIKDAVIETKQAIRQGVHDLRDDLNATSIKVQEAISKGDSQIGKKAD